MEPMCFDQCGCCFNKQVRSVYGVGYLMILFILSKTHLFAIWHLMRQHQALAQSTNAYLFFLLIVSCSLSFFRKAIWFCSTLLLNNCRNRGKDTNPLPRLFTSLRFSADTLPSDSDEKGLFVMKLTTWAEGTIKVKKRIKALKCKSATISRLSD